MTKARPVPNRRLPPRFWLLWTSEGVSSIGSQVTLIALPLTAVIFLHAAPFTVGALQAAVFVPIILVGLVAGVIVDRVPSIRLLRLMNWGQALFIGLVPICAALGLLSIWLLIVLALLASSLTVFGDLAVQSALPGIVDVDQLTAANSGMTFMQGIALTCGPALAGVLVAALDAPTAMSADAISFVLAASLLYTMRTRSSAESPGAGSSSAESPGAGSSGAESPGAVSPDRQAGPRRAPRASMPSQISEGVRFVLRQPVLRAIIISAGVLNLFSGMVFALEILFLARDLHLSSMLIGVMFAVQGVVSIVASLSVMRVNAWVGVGQALIAGLVLMGVSTLCLSLSQGPTLLVAGIVVVAGSISAFGAPLFNVNAISLRQATTPKELLGRVNATARLMIMGSRPIGSLLGGALAALFATRPVLVLAALGMTAGGGWLYTTEVRAMRRLPDAPRPLPAEQEVAHAEA